MVVDLKHVRNLRKSFSQERLVKVTGVVMEVRVRNVLFVSSRPLYIFLGFTATHGKPLLEQRHLLPESVAVNLVAESKLRMETTTVDVLL